MTRLSLFYSGCAAFVPVHISLLSFWIKHDSALSLPASFSPSMVAVALPGASSVSLQLDLTPRYLISILTANPKALISAT